MRCAECDVLIEAIAAGHDGSAEAMSHVSGCARCRAALARAQAIDRALVSWPEPAPPAGFADSVMARVRRDRWQTEQSIDVGFNLAVAAGLLLIGAGITGLAWSAGLLSLGGEVADGLTLVVNTAASRISTELPTLAIAAALFAMTVAAWWYVEGEVSI